MEDLGTCPWFSPLNPHALFPCLHQRLDVQLAVWTVAMVASKGGDGDGT